MGQESGFELTLSVLKRADHGGVIGLLEQALREPDENVRARAASFLADLEDESVDRLLVRRFTHIGEEAQAKLLGRPDAVLRSADQLSAVDAGEIRANVVEALVALADRRSIPIILRYLDDPAAPIRDRARSFLHLLSRRYGTQLAAEGGRERRYLRTALGLALRGGDVTPESLRTILALGRDGFVLLLPIMREETSEGAAQIAAFLRAETSSSVVECLFFLAASGYEQTRRLAREILKGRREGAFLTLLAESIAASSESDRAPILVALRHLPWQALAREDLDRLAEPVQRTILEIARSFGGSSALRVEKLVPFLGSRFTSIRAEALHALCDLPLKLILPFVEPLLGDPAEVIALRVTSLLDVHENPGAFKLLVRQLAHPSEHVREEAARKLGGRTFSPLMRRWPHLAPELRGRLAATLARVDRRFFEAMRAELACGDPPRIGEALEVARTLGPAAALLPSLLDLATFPNPFVRATAASLLGNFGTTETRVALERLLADPDERVVANAIEALGRPRDRSVAPRLRPFLGHRNGRVRANAVVALHGLGDRAVYEPLRAMVAALDPGLRRSARWAVEKIREGLEARTARAIGPAIEEYSWVEASGAALARREVEHAGTRLRLS